MHRVRGLRLVGGGGGSLESPVDGAKPGGGIMELPHRLVAPTGVLSWWCSLGARLEAGLMKVPAVRKICLPRAVKARVGSPMLACSRQRVDRHGSRAVVLQVTRAQHAGQAWPEQRFLCSCNVDGCPLGSGMRSPG